jgi:late competence protein required for DNA uptake (superfamily II DNA/RNA helicase)
MSEQRPAEKIPLTIYLSADMAARLNRAAEAQKRSAVDLAADLLDRHLPRPQTGVPKGIIPYS